MKTPGNLIDLYIDSRANAGRPVDGDTAALMVAIGHAADAIVSALGDVESKVDEMAGELHDGGRR